MFFIHYIVGLAIGIKIGTERERTKSEFYYKKEKINDLEKKNKRSMNGCWQNELANTDIFYIWKNRK